MPKDRAIICAALCAACLVGFGTLLYAVSPSISAPPTPAASLASPASNRPLNASREPDGFPVATTRAQSLVNECARASGVNPYGTITATQVQDLTTCVDLLRPVVTRSK
jgi:hypothetical protein